MKFALGIAAVLSAIAANADDWRETLTPGTPGGFPMLRPLHSTYKFGWTKFDAAIPEFTLSIPRVLH